jgi:DNA-binding GntR family transcriptional regulator
MALVRFMARMTDKDMAYLHHIVEEMRLAAKADNLAQLSELDLAFHEYILRVADHQLAHKLWKLLEVGVRRCIHVRHTIYSLLDEVVGSHPALIHAIESRDQARAVAELHHHISESAAHIIEKLAAMEPENSKV